MLLQVINKRTPTPERKARRTKGDKTPKQHSKLSNVKVTRWAFIAFAKLHFSPLHEATRRGFNDGREKPSGGDGGGIIIGNMCFLLYSSFNKTVGKECGGSLGEPHDAVRCNKSHLKYLISCPVRVAAVMAQLIDFGIN